MLAGAKCARCGRKMVLNWCPASAASYCTARNFRNPAGKSARHWIGTAGFRLQAIAIPMSATVCKQHTAPRTLCKRNIFSRVAQDGVPDPVWSEQYSLKISKCLSFSRVMSHLHSSWSDLPPFPLPQRLSSLLPPFRGDEHPPGPRTAHKVRSQVMSPTPSLRWAVQRLLLFTDHQGGHFFAQYTIPVRTPQLHLCLRK